MREKSIVLFFLLLCVLIPSQTTKEIDEKYKIVINLFSSGKKNEALGLAKNIVKLSDKINYSKGRADGYSSIVYYYYLENDFSNCIKYIDLIEKEVFFQKNVDFQTHIYSLLGKIYLQSKLYDEARKIFKKNIITARMISDKSKRIYQEAVAYQDLMTLYNFQQKYDSVYYYNTKCYNFLLRETSRSETLDVFLARTALSLQLIHKRNENIDSVSFYKKKSLEFIPKNIKDTANKLDLFRIIAAIYYTNGLFEESKKYNDIYVKYAERIQSVNHAYNAYQLKSKISDTLKSPTSYKDLKKYVKLTEEINSLEKKEIVNTVGNFIKAKETQIKKEKKEKTYLKALIVFAVFLLFFIIYFFTKYLRKKNVEKKRLISEKQIEISVLESKVNTAFEEIIELAKSNSPNFFARFQEVYPEFCENLIQRYPDIQNTDLTYCAYIKLNFSSKEIANYTFVTHKAIRMKRYRLRKKLNLSSEQDLDVWMKNLDNSTNHKI